MNLSDCAMTKENTPIFSCVDVNWAEGTPASNGTSSLDKIKGQTAMQCKNHKERAKDDKSTIITFRNTSLRCPDFWQESKNAINDLCERPGMFVGYWIEWQIWDFWTKFFPEYYRERSHILHMRARRMSHMQTGPPWARTARGPPRKVVLVHSPDYHMPAPARPTADLGHSALRSLWYIHPTEHN